MTEAIHPRREDSTHAGALLTGSWQVSPEVWTDERTMDELVQRVRDHMKAAAHERAEIDRETAKSGDE